VFTALLRDCLGGEMQRLSSKLYNNITGRPVCAAKQLALSLAATVDVCALCVCMSPGHMCALLLMRGGSLS
jgi:hypothetical protein